MNEVKLEFWPTTKVIILEKRAREQSRNTYANKNGFDWSALPVYTLETKSSLKLARYK